MYMKEPEKCYRYNDAEDADFTKIVDPKHTALLMIDMQNDFCSPKGKFAQAGRAADSIIEIVPACRKLLEAARQANVFVVHIQQSTLPGEQSDNGGWIAFKTRDGKAAHLCNGKYMGMAHIEELAPYCDGENGSCYEPIITKYRPDAFLKYKSRFDFAGQSYKERSVLRAVPQRAAFWPTVMGAAFHNYYTCVAEDAVATSVDGAHERAIWLMKKRYLVRTVEKILSCWQA